MTERTECIVMGLLAALAIAAGLVLIVWSGAKAALGEQL
jgi:ABC-type nickel/cobalt efflux system permease component RcnA